jgi:hypothetical protein
MFSSDSCLLSPEFCLLFFLTIARFPCGTRNDLLPLLPSGSDGVRNISLRRTRLSQTWRRERDSNPRYTFWEYTRFPVVHLRPARSSLQKTKGNFMVLFTYVTKFSFYLQYVICVLRNKLLRQNRGKNHSKSNILAL